MPSPVEQMLSIYLPRGSDLKTVRTRLSELSQAHGLGRGPGPLLAALSEGAVTLTPANQADEAEPPPGLADLLIHVTTLLEATHPRHAAELRRRAGLLKEAGV